MASFSWCGVLKLDDYAESCTKELRTVWDEAFALLEACTYEPSLTVSSQGLVAVAGSSKRRVIKPDDIR